MDTYSHIVKDFTERFSKYTTLNIFEKTFFNNYSNDDFRNLVNQYTYINSSFVNMKTYANLAKNIQLVDVCVVLIGSKGSKIFIKSYMLSMYIRNSTYASSFETMGESKEIDLSAFVADNISKFKNIDCLTKKDIKYFSYNVDKEVDFEKIRVVIDLILNFIS